MPLAYPVARRESTRRMRFAAVAQGSAVRHCAVVIERKTRTLDRLLSRSGLCSRTDARAAIAAGRVTVDGRVVRNPETWVEPARHDVRLDGEVVRERPREVWVLHKPTGFVTTARDERGRRTVYDLLPSDHTWLAPVGRLDLDTSGLLLFTNDSVLADAITSPDTKLPKTYVATCRGRLTDAALAALANGVTLRDGPTLPAEVRRLGGDAATTTIELVIVEGRNRQVRRMVEAVESEVEALHRSRIGPLDLGSLALGEARQLDADEVETLRAAVSSGPRRPRTNRGSAR
jgi:23S rRNA pseudouridine2605 synthase